MIRALACLLLASTALNPASAADWRLFYEDGFKTQPEVSWIGPGTRSERVGDSLRIVDPSTETGSGRLYCYRWEVDPQEGAAVEARMKLTAAGEPWGACVNVADGVHEEDISFLPDRVMLSHAKVSAPFPTTDGFHTYRMVFKGQDIQVFADGEPLIDGTGRFTTETLVKGRNRVGFGSSASTATSDSVWQMVRFKGSQVEPAPPITLPDMPGLEVSMGSTVEVMPNTSFQSFFRFASGMLQVGRRRSQDDGQTWHDTGGPWVGACQLPDGEVIQLDYRTGPGDAPGWFSSALQRWDAEGNPLPTLRARLHVPDFVPMVDDDGSKREGPWCDHSIIGLRDASLLAACCGTFKGDTTPISSYPEGFGAMKYCGWVCRSTDRGLSWEYLSTVTAEPSLGSEGCNEMDLVRAPDGSLLCLFRTGGSAAAPSPMYQCRSTDEGHTWGAPQQVADRGVWPNVCVMDSGVLVCAYGRPDNWLAFSLDSGKT